MKPYHWKNGVFFERRDGFVVIVRREDPADDDSAPLWLVVIPEKDWNDIVRRLRADE